MLIWFDTSDIVLLIRFSSFLFETESFSERSATGAKQQSSQQQGTQVILVLPDKKEKILKMGLIQDVVSGDQADVNLPRGPFSRPPQPQC